MAPVGELFAREFPDFEPYPWGKQRWIQLLVRNIMLAEALVDDFGRCFEGVGPEEAERLADSFALERCERRGPLIDVLAAECRPSRRAGDGPHPG